MWSDTLGVDVHTDVAATANVEPSRVVDASADPQHPPRHRQIDDAETASAAGSLYCRDDSHTHEASHSFVVVRRKDRFRVPASPSMDLIEGRRDLP